MRVRNCFNERLLRKTKPSNQYAIKSLETSLSYIEDAELFYGQIRNIVDEK